MRRGAHLAILGRARFLFARFHAAASASLARYPPMSNAVAMRAAPHARAKYQGGTVSRGLHSRDFALWRASRLCDRQQSCWERLLPPKFRRIRRRLLSCHWSRISLIGG